MHPNSKIEKADSITAGNKYAHEKYNEAFWIIQWEEMQDRIMQMH
jgi:hypothetical protein